MDAPAVARVLAMVAVAEQRPVDEVDVSFWMNTLNVHAITEEEFRLGVVQHYADSTYPIRPGHVWNIVAAHRARAAVDVAIAETQARAEQREAMDRAFTTGDWSKFNERWPGVRQKEVQRNIDWWVESGEPLPDEVVQQAMDLDIVLPLLCKTCNRVAGDTGRCAQCQGRSGADA